MSEKSLLVLVLIAGVASAASPVSAQLLLDADFDDKTIDAPLGTGGAAVGEPVYIAYITAIVRSAPFSSPSLEIQDDDDYISGTASFNFLGDAEITTGFVSISADVWLSMVDNYEIGVRESGSAACFYLNLEFRDSGNARTWDSTGILQIDTGYPTGRAIPIQIIFDMDAGTYDLHYDGGLVLDDRAHGVGGGCGVGSVSFGALDDPDYDGTFYVDNVLVTTYLFKAGFEVGDFSEWSSAVGSAK